MALLCIVLAFYFIRFNMYFERKALCFIYIYIFVHLYNIIWSYQHHDPPHMQSFIRHDIFIIMLISSNKPSLIIPALIACLIKSSTHSLITDLGKTIVYLPPQQTIHTLYPPPPPTSTSPSNTPPTKHVIYYRNQFSYNYKLDERIMKYIIKNNVQFSTRRTPSSSLLTTKVTKSPT